MLNQTFKNTIAVFSGRLVGQFFGLIMGVILARYLGPENYGKYSFAISTCYIFMIFTDFGMNDLFVRDLAADKSLTSTYLGASLIAKTILAVVSIFLLYLFLRFLDFSEETLVYTMVFALHIFFIAQITTISSIFRAHEKMVYNAYVTIFNGVVGLCLVFLLVTFNQTLIVLIFSRVIVFLFGFLVSIFLVCKIITRPSFNFNSLFLISIVKKSFPFLTIGIIHSLYFKVDIIMLSKIKGEVFVGYYTPAANDLFFGLFIIPGTISTVVYPIFARHYSNSVEKLSDSLGFTIKLMALIGVPISVGTFLLSSQIIYLIFGEQYQHSIIVLQVMSLAVSFAFVREPLGFAIASIGKEHFLMWMNSFFLVMNIALNAVLIPVYSHVGAAVTSVMCIILSLLVGFYVLKKQIGGLVLVPNFYKPIVASFIMGVVVLLLRDHLHVVLTICVGALFYVGAILACKPFSRYELEIMKSIVKIK